MRLKPRELLEAVDTVYKLVEDLRPETLPGSCGEALLMEAGHPELVRTGEVTQDQNDFHVGFMHFLAHHLEKRGLYTEVKLVDQGTVDENMELNIHWE